MCLAVPGQIVAVTDLGELTRAGRVRFGGLEREVNLALVPEAGVGDFVLVHVGLALGQVDEAEARRTLDDLRLIEELGEGSDRSANRFVSPPEPGAPETGIREPPP